MAVRNLEATSTKSIQEQCLSNFPVPDTPEKDGAQSNARRWPPLKSLVLSNEQRLARRDGVGGSDANVILSGDAACVRDLWLQKRGQATYPDLSNRLAVMLGCWSEPFNRQWYEQQTGQLAGRAGGRLERRRVHAGDAAEDRR